MAIFSVLNVRLKLGAAVLILQGHFLNNTLHSSRACIAIFAARETPEALEETIAASLRGSTVTTHIDVLVNGNRVLADRMAIAFRAGAQADADRVRIWYLARGDKANAWNQHIHHIWDGAALAFYIDGYVALMPDAIANLTRAMHATPGALAGSGLPSVGRTSQRLRQEMLAEGGMHGNLCCIRDSALVALRERNIRLPLGLYRTDGTLGAMLSFGLDPMQNDWSPRKYVALAADATWRTKDKKWWRWADIQASYKRRARQAQGQLENRAVRDHLAVCRLPPEAMPATAAALVTKWVERCPEDAASLLRSSAQVRRAWEHLCAAPDPWLESEITPVRVIHP